MIPVHLKLRNFLSYRDEVALDFTSISIACLSGDNGSGKTALLDAITWALWGKARSSSDRELMSLGATEMDVTFIFQLAGHEYRVFRRRSLTGRSAHTLEFDVREVGGGSWLSIAGDNVSQTNQKIVNLLNMEYDTFVNSSYILQGRADAFTQRTPGERKRILGDILNLKEYEELQDMAKKEHRLVSDRLNATRARIQVLDERLAARPALQAELETVSASLTDASEKHDLAQQLCETLRRELTHQQQARDALQAARSRAEREQRSLAAIEAQLAERGSEQASLLALVAQADEIAAGVAEHDRWRAENQRFTAALRQAQALERQQTAAEQAIATQLATLQRDRDRSDSALRNALRRLDDLQQEAARLDALRAASVEDAIAAGDLAEARDAIELLREERATLLTENKQLNDRMHEIKAHIETLDTGEAECPVCRQPLAPTERERVRDTWTAEGGELGARYRANRDRVKAIDAELEQLAVAEKSLAARVQANAERAGQIQQLVARLAGRDEIEREVEQHRADLERVDRAIESEDFAFEERQRLADARQARSALDYDDERHNQAAAAEERYALFVKRAQDLDLARARLSAADDAIASLRAQASERREALAEAEAEVARLLPTVSFDDGLAERVAEAEDELERLSSERSALWSRQGGIERQLADLDKLAEDRAELNAQESALGLEVGALSELVEAFGQKGIQALIIDSVLPELEAKANELLQRMSSSNLRVSFRSQRVLQSSDRVAETLDIIIRDEHGERPYALFSGGEAFRVDFAIRVALSKLLAGRAGANIDMLVIDEGFGTQDSRGRDGLIEALRSIERDFRKILVITHIGEIRELFPTRIDVAKTDRGSQVTIN